jgi:hypothetical protein
MRRSTMPCGIEDKSDQKCYVICQESVYTGNSDSRSIRQSEFARTSCYMFIHIKIKNQCLFDLRIFWKQFFVLILLVTLQCTLRDPTLFIC